MTLATVSQLISASYTGAGPFAEGLTADDYRDQIGEHGETCRWWKAFKAPDGTTGPNGETVERNGLLYIEQTIPSTVRVYVSETQREVYDPEFGLLTKGQTQIACMPDEIELARGDRVLLNSRLMKERIAVTATGATNSLQRRHVSAIVEVIHGGAVLAASRYTLSTLANGTGQINWTGTAPTGTVLIEFRYNPLYVYLDVSDRNPPRGADGERLPQRGILTLEQKLDEGEG